MNNQKLADNALMWKPSKRFGEPMRKFKQVIENKYNINIDDYWDFHKWSIEHLPELWAELWNFAGILYSKKFDKVIDLNIPFDELPVWFEGAKLNLAENLLKYRGDKLAFVIANGAEGKESMTYSQLFEASKLYASAFRKFGLKKGDVVACQMSNRKEAIIAMIAVISIGAIWAGVLSLLGSKAVLSRIRQIQPKVYFTIDRIPHERKHISMLEKIEEISEGLPSLTKVIIVPSNEDVRSKDISTIKNSCFLDEFLQLGREKDGSVLPMQFEQVSLNHPVYIIFTSGTTGPPKAIIHGMGFLLPHFRDFSLHMDSGESSVWFSQSSLGWVSWNATASLLFCGATLVLFEESPFFRNSRSLWDFIDQYRATHVFIPACVLDEYRKRGEVPTKDNSLESLKVIIAGASFVKPQNYDFVYEKVKKDVMFSSICGCTETMGSGFLPDATLPIYRGESSALNLGVKAEIVDDYGKPVFGEMGEAVISNPIPNMAVGLWNDKDNSIFRKNYFSKYPGKFATGDYGIMNPFTKGVVICCRSDETLKQRGCRFGSTDIYNVVDAFHEVEDSLCVSQYNKTMDERAVLFLKMKEGYSFSVELAKRIREAIERELTNRHVPDVILEIKDIPYNINGKKLETVVKKIINGKPYNAENIINPESLEYFHSISEL